MDNQRIQTQRFNEIARMIGYLISVFFCCVENLADSVRFFQDSWVSIEEEPAETNSLLRLETVKKRE